ncbi:uncharacterized protein LOC122304801 [Carya illinoinensis]|uniref:uncharacterized protein LOC122304801 n=1 Tax=Carya illinoinensis TaxID=32201 RepID=UPI001C72952A|nr:uncharacterized protein LOC122304801 [Carya illinoinensis]
MRVGVLLQQEDLKWKQRAKKNWYCMGDKNTKFFHACANQRRNKNLILSVLDSNANLKIDQDGIAEAFREHFSGVYTTAAPSKRTINICLQAVEGIVGEDVCRAALQFLNGGRMDGGLNHTFVALIPKLKEPKSVNDFRPISLCNVMYKVIAKVLANRLKTVLSAVISSNQSAFIPERLITDNIVAAYEVLHSMRTRQKDKMGSMALKLDISKAYDRVEWKFLQGIMQKLGFGDRWIQLIMDCVSTVSYAVLTNGRPVEIIKPTRGLRQGDSLSPYLFLLCAEGLSAMLNQAERRKELKGVAVARGGTRVTHLLFADDCIIFGRASWIEWRRIRSILEIYELALGQSLNKQKTTVFFSPNAKANVKKGILKELGARLILNCEKYLGLPVMVGRSRYNSFRCIKDRVWQRVNNWKNKLLSPAGKEVLLKAVIQAIPNYYMNVFRLPKKLCTEIAVVMARFWWGYKANDKRIQCKSWPAMGVSKAEGGLGFRELESFNSALLAKQCWRLLSNPRSLAAKVLKDKYYRNSDLLQAKLGYRPSLIWKSLWSSMGLLKEGLVWRVATGHSIKIWEDKWIPTMVSHCIQTPNTVLSKEARVQELIDPSGVWKEELIREIFNEDEAKVICSLPISQSGMPDKQIWGLTKDGIFSVRSAYHLEVSRKKRESGEMSAGISIDWKGVWRLNVPGVVKVFLWKPLNDSLPTRWNLFKRKVVKNPICPVCEFEVESVTHSLWSCKGAMDVWAERKSPVQKWASSEFGSPSAVVKQAETTLEEFQLAQRGDQKGKGCPVARRRVKWKAPGDEVVKVNWDAGVNLKEERIGIGVVIRDDKGEVLVALCSSRGVCCSPVVAELHALWRAMKLCAELNF